MTTSTPRSRLSEEAHPLLSTVQHHGHHSADSGPTEKRQLGLTSASLLVFGGIVGTGIFATPSMILRASGSVGLSFVMWLFGAAVAACGTAVYIELGMTLPRSGGEKVYLEYLFRYPRFLATCTYATYAMFIPWQAAHATVFGEYVLHAVDPTGGPSPISGRVVGVLCLTFAFLVHGFRVRWGVMIQNTVAVFKLTVLVCMALTGLAVLSGMKGFKLQEPPHNFDWSTMWEGSGSGGANALVTGLYTVIWCFKGYGNANFVLSEVRDPARTVKLAASTAVLLASLLYLFINIAYYAVVDRDEILNSGRIAAALFFGKLWGIRAERFLSVIIAFSALGNVFTNMFSHSRVVQELGKEGTIPFPSFFASSKPFNTPLAGLFAQWTMSTLLLILVPPGDAFQFMLNMVSYPFALVNTFISGGLILLHSGYLPYDWDPPFQSPYVATMFFFISNVFLISAPWLPPVAGFRLYEKLPYWSHAFTASMMALVGVTYWYVRFRWLPARGRYRMVQEKVVDDDGTSRYVVRKEAIIS